MDYCQTVHIVWSIAALTIMEMLSLPVAIVSNSNYSGTPYKGHPE